MFRSHSIEVLKPLDTDFHKGGHSERPGVHIELVAPAVSTNPVSSLPVPNGDRHRVTTMALAFVEAIVMT